MMEPSIAYDYMMEAYKRFSADGNVRGVAWNQFVNMACALAENNLPNPFKEDEQEVQEAKVAMTEEATSISSEPYCETLTDNANDRPEKGNIVTAVANKIKKRK